MKRRRNVIALVPVLCWLAGTSAVEARTHLVRPGAGGGPGTVGIQAALDAAAPGDTILLADGVYKGPGNRDLDFRGKPLVLRSGHGPKSCVIDCEGQGRGLRFHSGETPACRVEGITIVGGRAEAADSTAAAAVTAAGGAILCQGASPLIAACVLTLNRAAAGGAIACGEGAAPGIFDCLLQQNTAEQGGGLHADGSAPQLVRCFFVQNTAERGGGLSTWGAAVRLEGCTFYGNGAVRGGGVACESDPAATLVECLLVSNQATHGGGVMADHAGPVLERCTLLLNGAGNGAALDLVEAHPVLRQSLIAGSARGAAVTGTGKPEIACSLIENNCGGDWVSCLEGLETSGGNQAGRGEPLSALFVDPNAGDFRLRPGSRRPAPGCGPPGASAPRLRPPPFLEGR